jgi:two-component system sensor histidine kinase BaeS
MKLRITAKLFLTVLASCLVVMLAMGVAMRHSIEQGFLEYVKEREAQRISTLSELLQDAYREHGGWDFLRGNRDAWTALLRASREGGPQAGGAGEGRSRSRGAREEALREGRPRADDNAPRARRDRPRTPPTLLLDAQGQEVIGHGRLLPTPSSLRHPVAVDGRTVGWLLTTPAPGLPEDADRQFLAQQLKATWLIAIVSVALAALVAMLLARRFLAPIRRLAGATHRLAAGDYRTRVDVQSDDELGQLAADFNALAETLGKNETMRRNFMADISHELRTPLAVLKGELEALEDGVRPFNANSRASLQAEVATLGKLIDDLYQLALGEVGALHYDMGAVDLGSLAVSAGNAFRERMQQKGLTLTVQASPATVQGDPQRLLQLLNNLLENSLRYTDRGGDVRLTVRETTDSVQLDLQDSAPGVPEPMLARIFERLFRLEASRNRERGGAGLGLALCQDIVAAHGGRIEAKPSPLGGVWIAVTLPRLIT